MGRRIGGRKGMDNNTRACIVMEIDAEGACEISIQGTLEDVTALMIEGNASFYKRLVQRHTYAELFAKTLLDAVAKAGAEKGAERMNDGAKKIGFTPESQEGIAQTHTGSVL